MIASIAVPQESVTVKVSETPAAVASVALITLYLTLVVTPSRVKSDPVIVQVKSAQPQLIMSQD